MLSENQPYRWCIRGPRAGEQVGIFQAWELAGMFRLQGSVIFRWRRWYIRADFWSAWHFCARWTLP